MRKTLPAALIGLVVLVSSASGQTSPRWLFGLETRLSETDSRLGSDYSIGVIPNFSYFLSNRVRLDGFFGLGYTDSDTYFLSLSPGVRFYHRAAPRRLRLNSGASVSFTLIEETGPFSPAPSDRPVYLRLVPIEVEYWPRGRAAFSFGLDYESRLSGRSSIDEDAFGMTAGFRIRLK